MKDGNEPRWARAEIRLRLRETGLADELAGNTADLTVTV